MSLRRYHINVVDTQRIYEWVVARTGGVYVNGGCCAIGLEDCGVLVGGAMYDHYMVSSIAIHFAMDRRGVCCRPFLYEIFAYPFVQLGVEKIIAPVRSDNENACAFVRRLGFELEGVIKGALVGADLLLFSMAKKKCRFVGDRYRSSM